MSVRCLGLAAKQHAVPRRGASLLHSSGAFSIPRGASSFATSSSQRCSPACFVHRPVLYLPRRAFASTSPNPLPSASSTHRVSPNLPSSFHPADPEIEGYKTRLTVERRIYKAITALPKFSSHPALLQAAPPLTDDAVDRYPIGHDDALARLRFEQLDVDSLDRVELLVSVEKEFGHEFSDQQFDQFSCVGDVIEAVLWSPQAR